MTSRLRKEPIDVHIDWTMRKIYTKRQFQVLCSCSLIGLTLLSLRRLSYSSLPCCGPLEGFFDGCTNDDAAWGNRIRKRNSTGGGDDTEKENDNDNREWRDFVEDYEKRFQRGPPAGSDAWFRFATKNQCETRRFYESLDADLQYWRNMNKTSSLLQWDRVIPEAIQWTTK